jgi:FSR family fosmidomycin resistance protein-like MFS transporter
VSERPGRHVDYPRVALISLGHGTNDLAGNLVTSLMPYLVIRGTITATLAGLIVLFYLLGSSVFQPFFGLMSDRTGRRFFAVFGPVWVAVAVSFMGFAHSWLPLFLLAALAGVGTAAFHPQAASMVAGLSKASRGWAMSLFSMGGNLGFALGPLVAAVIALVGFQWTIAPLFLAIPVTVLLFLYAPDPTANAEPFDKDAVRREVVRSWRSLALIVSVIAVRSGVQFALIVFLPLYYHAHGMPAQIGSYLASVLSLFGAVGGLIGGRLSDRLGRKMVVVPSLLITAPLIVLALVASGFLVWPVIAVAGAALLASNSVTVVQGQELLPASTGIASGLTLGLGFGLSGVISASMTTLSDHIGVTDTVHLVPVLPLIAAVLAMMVPDTFGGAGAAYRRPAAPRPLPGGQ